MKKALVIIFSLIAVLAIVMIFWNIVFGQNLLQVIYNAFAERINQMWSSVTGQTDAVLIPTQAVSESSYETNWG